MKKPPAQKTAKTGMETPVTSLPNIGKDTAAKLEKIGIRTAEEFLARDPYLVFEKLRKKVNPTLCRCTLASIVGAKRGARWHTITKQTAREYEKRHPKHR